MRILIQNRPNALTHRGGDTVLMEALAGELRVMGVHVDVDVTTKADLTSYDLIHLFNFATAQFTEHLAKRVHAAGKPYVVTTLYEDWPRFYNQMQHAFSVLRKYIELGQPRDAWQELASTLKHCEPCEHLPNQWTAQHAAALLVTGAEEASTIQRDFGANLKIFTNHVACDLVSSPQGPELFVAEYGIEDFVLCVGRLETRKNQLMLLKALEESDFPLVIAGGGFSYQPDYVAACKRFRRKGRTVYVDRISPEMLSSMYAAARVHALPSWYELPGMVSLEAARHGANIVATDYGTTRDYLGDDALYAAPDKPEDILNAVTASYFKPRSSSLCERATQFTWQRSAKELVEVYAALMRSRN